MTFRLKLLKIKIGFVTHKFNKYFFPLQVKLTERAGIIVPALSVITLGVNYLPIP